MLVRRQAPGSLGETAATGGALRVLRSGVVGTCALLIAYGGHLAAGGSALPVLDVVVLAALAVSGAWLASRRRWTFPSLLAALSVFGLAVHVATMGLGALTSPVAAMPSDMPGMTGSPWLMLAAHAGAALVTATLLQHAEGCLMGLVGALLCTPWAIAWFCVAPVNLGPRLPQRSDRRVLALATQWRGACRPGRGPPLPA